MKRTMLDVLACTVCKSHPLELKVLKEDGSGILSGSLSCKACGLSYPIEDGIPNMLPPAKSK